MVTLTGGVVSYTTDSEYKVSVASFYFTWNFAPIVDRLSRNYAVFYRARELVFTRTKLIVFTTSR